MSAINRMIDEACGYTPEMDAKHKAQRAKERRQAKIMGDLFDALDNWYQHDKGFTRIALRGAYSKVLEEDERNKKGK